MSGHYQYAQDGSLYHSSGSHHYSHPYAPNGEPSQPLRNFYGLPNLGTNGVENGPSYYQQPYPPPSPQAIPPPASYEPIPRRSTSDLAPIPAPVIKTEYAAPVFMTFQERKRAKEQAMLAQAEAGYGYSPSRSSLPQGPITPLYTNGPAILTQPDRSQSASPQPGDRPPSRGAHSLPRPPSGNDVRPMPPPSIRTDLHPSTPGSPIKSSANPSPIVRPSSTRPLPSPIRTSSAPEAGPCVVRSPPPQSPVSPSVLERSDTISSVKSLDRAPGFGSPSKRPLPKPPVAVVASKSLDRGLPSGIGAITPLVGLAQGYEKRTGRRLPSTVTEMSEGSEGDLSAEMGRMGLDSPIKAVPQINLPPVSATVEPSVPIIVGPPSISIPTIMPPIMVEPTAPPTIIEPGSQPATFTPLPSIDIGDSDDDSTPGIVFGGLPTIAVSSFDTSDQASAVPTSTRTPQPTRIDPTSAILCTGCSNPIIGRIVSAMGQRWHPQCFTCGECGELLEHVSSYEFNGRPYCHLDYHDKFAHRCHHCKTPIVEPRFITLDDPILGQRFYHELHFFCSECGDPFLDPSRSSAPGTERTRSTEAEEEETNAFVIQKGHPYCERCHLRLHKPKCKGCRKPIPDVAVDAMGGKWHQECFVCEECGNGFANSLFFPQDGKAFCTECYGTMVGN